jgi:hypothetical protein
MRPVSNGGDLREQACKVIDRFSEDIDLTYDIRKLKDRN